MKIILITGGARSGKSRLAQDMALKSGRSVLFVATAAAEDEEMRQRIEEHRRLRPNNWHTLEVGTHVGGEIRKNLGTARMVIIDCVTLLVNNIFSKYTDPNGEITDAALLEKEVISEIGELSTSLDSSMADFIIVTNEVGLGMVPVNRMARLYRDLLGKANQRLAERADEVYLLVAGLPVKIKPAR